MEIDMNYVNPRCLLVLILGFLAICTPTVNAQLWQPVQYQDSYVFHGRFEQTSNVLDVDGSHALLRGTNGGAYIFRLEADDTWILEAEIAMVEEGISFGFQGCIDDGIAIISALGWVDAEGVRRGRAYAYERDSKTGTWNATYIFEPLDLAPEDAGLAGYNFGFRMALDGGLVVITDSRAANAGDFNVGYVRFFERTAPGNWTASDTYFGLAADDRFGSAVDIHRGTVDICAIGANQLEIPDANGTIEFFIRNEAGSWIPQSNLLEGPGESSWPTDIDITGGRMAVSASNQYGLPGIVQIWEGGEDDWTRRTTLLGGGEEKGGFGQTVQLGTSKMVVTQWFTAGLPSDGAAMIYEVNSEGEWRLTNTFNGALDFPSNLGATAGLIGDHLLVRNASGVVRNYLREVFDYPPDPVKDTCPGDINGDGVVDAADLGLLLSTWGFCL